MAPSKLELLAAWLPGRPWYVDQGRPPALAKVGGFRLDDPAGEVGLEMMIVTDTAGDVPITYHVPMTYRGAPLPDAEKALIGTSEHGVLGTRYIYDGPHDPVLVAQLLALVQGHATAQAQSVSDTPDPTVRSSPVLAGAALPPSATTVAADGPDGTLLRIAAVEPAPLDLVVRVVRVLDNGVHATDGVGHVQLPVHRPDGTESDTIIITVTQAAG
jgi:hypothetical protein